jgi:hypothetical protein
MSEPIKETKQQRYVRKNKLARVWVTQEFKDRLQSGIYGNNPKQTCDHLNAFLDSPEGFASLMLWQKSLE